MNKIVVIVFVLISTVVLGQTTSISPYSGFGIGEIAPKGYDRSFAMGGVGLGFNDSLSINAMNPASYGFFVRENPIFQVGVKGQNLKLSSEVNSNEIFNFSMNNFVIAFPIADKGGIVLGVNPATTVGYNIVVAEEYTDAEDYTFPIYNKYDGNGGYSKYYLGGAYRLLEVKDSISGLSSVLSLGFNVSYVGGKKHSRLNVIYNDSASTYKNTKYTLTEVIGDFGFDFGVQYLTYLKKVSDREYIGLSVGATVNIPKYMNTRFETLVTTYDLNSDVESNVDTVLFSDHLEGDTYIPLNYGFGFMLDFNRKLQIGVDFETQNWSEFNQLIEGVEVRNKNLTSMYRVSGGLQYNPVPLNLRKVNTSYLKMISYRMGVRYTQEYLKFDDYQLVEKAVSLGLNLPFSKSQSYSSLNIGIEFGSGGTTDNELIREDFVNFMIGINLMPHRYNRWFRKRKFD